MPGIFSLLESFLGNKKTFFIAVLIPALISFYFLINGNITLWVDPARDLLLALDNLNKPSLIGSPSGIPGVFYGPYWIWMLSLTLLFSTDPRFITFFVLFLPYFIILPLVLYSFRKFLGNVTPLIIWMLFISSFSFYATNLWNIHPAPLLIFIYFYLAIFTDFRLNKISDKFKILLLGFVAGLIANFTLSFGIGIVLSLPVFLLINFIKGIVQERSDRKTVLLNLLNHALFYSIGVILAFAPFLLFEFRHNFLQSTTLLKALTNSFLYNSALVGQQGFSGGEIIQRFMGVLPDLLKLPRLIGIFLIPILIGYLLGIKNSSTKLGNEEIKLVSLSFIILSLCIYLYLTTKNPVWEYHYLGMEVIVLFILAIILKHGLILRKIISVFALIIFSIFIFSSISSIVQNFSKPTSYENLYSLVDGIMQDSGNDSYSIQVKNDALFFYEYEYLIKVSKSQNKPVSQNDAKYIYLVYPKEVKKEARGFFSEEKTPSKNYETLKSWITPDGTEIVKRVRIK